MRALWDGYCYDLHFIDEEAELNRSREFNLLEARVFVGMDLGFESRGPGQS